MSESHELLAAGNGPQEAEDGVMAPEAGVGPQNAPQGRPEPDSGPQVAPSLYDYQNLILSGLYRLLDGLIGDGAKLILIVEDGDYLEVVRNHDDPWSVFDRLACSDDEDEPLPGPGSRGRLLN